MAIGVGPPDSASIDGSAADVPVHRTLRAHSLLIVSTLSKQKRPFLSEDHFLCIVPGLMLPVLVPTVPDTLSRVAMYRRDSLTPES